MRAILFDLDDTLVDVKGAFVRCVEELFAGAGISPPDEGELRVAHAAHRNHRPRLAAWIAASARDLGGALDPMEVARELTSIARHVRRDPEILETVGALADTYRIAIVTNGSVAVQRSKWQAAGLSQYVPEPNLIVSGQHRVRKPHRRMFELGLASVGASAKDALFVGDDERDDIRGARAAGLATCRVAPTGSETAADFSVERVTRVAEAVACWT